MKRYTIKESRREQDLLYLTLQPDTVDDYLEFEAGQYATIAFRGRNGRLSPMRCFSIVSSPDQPEVLQFAMRVGGSFTQALAELGAGDEILVQGPFGDFVINEQYDRRIVMIAGGIGITPFMSMIRSATIAKSPIPMTLLYSYRRGFSVPFEAELKALEKANPNFRVISFVSGEAFVPEVPRMLSGKMTEQHLDQITGGNYAGNTYFLCGPKGFMESIESMLTNRRVSEDRIVTESFTQASKLTIGNGWSLQKLTYSLAGAILLLGIFSVAFLDLSRYVPKHTQAATVQTIEPTTTNREDDDTPASAASPVSTPTTTTPTVTTAPATRTTTQAQPTYQAPVSSVS